MTDGHAKQADRDRFVADITAIAGMPRPLSLDARPFNETDTPLDSLAISEIVVMLHDRYGLDLLDAERLRAVREADLADLHEIAWLRHSEQRSA